MMITKPPRLIPPLARPNPQLKAVHPNHKPPSQDLAKLPILQKKKPTILPGSKKPITPVKPEVPAEPRPNSPEGRPNETPLPPAAHSSALRRPLRCRECGAKEAWPAAGWYQLRRRIVKNSVPPEVLSETERKAWARSIEQRMGLYCSIDCLEKSMERLRDLDRLFRERGTGTRLVEREPSASAEVSRMDVLA